MKYVSPRKLDSLPDGSVVEFDGGRGWWKKVDGEWDSGYGIPFTSKSLVHYHNGAPFVIKVQASTPAEGEKR